MFERFTPLARSVVLAAIGEAERRGDGIIGSEHLLFGVVSVSSPAVLEVIGVSPEEVRRGLSRLDQLALLSAGIDVESVDGPRRTIRGRSRYRRLTSGAKRVLRCALDEAALLGDRHIGPEHILLAITNSPARDPVTLVIEQIGVSSEQIRRDLLTRLRRSA